MKFYKKKIILGEIAEFVLKSPSTIKSDNEILQFIPIINYIKIICKYVYGWVIRNINTQLNYNLFRKDYQQFGKSREVLKCLVFKYIYLKINLNTIVFSFRSINPPPHIFRQILNNYDISSRQYISNFINYIEIVCFIIGNRIFFKTFDFVFK